MKCDSIDLTRAPTDDEWFRINVFKERAEALIRRWQQVRRPEAGRSLSLLLERKPDGTHNISGDAPPDDDNLQLLYGDARHLYLQEEPCNLLKTVNLISTLSRDARVTLCMRDLKKASTKSIVELLEIQFQGRKLSSTELIDAMFNARYFHSDRERRDELANLNRVLTKEGVRILLFHAIRDLFISSKNLYLLIQGLRPDHLKVLVPAYYSNKRSDARPRTPTTTHP